MSDREAIEILKGMYNPVSLDKDDERHNLAITKAIIALNFKIASGVDGK